MFNVPLLCIFKYFFFSFSKYAIKLSYLKCHVNEEMKKKMQQQNNFAESNTFNNTPLLNIQATMFYYCNILIRVAIKNQLRIFDTWNNSFDNLYQRTKKQIGFN